VPPGRVREAGLAAMLGQDSVLRTPAPTILFKAMTDQGMAYEAIFWHASPTSTRCAGMRSAPRSGTRSTAPAFPSRYSAACRPAPTIRPHCGGARRPGRAGAAAADPAPVGALQAFPAEAIDTLVDAHALQLYGRGERVIRQDEAGQSMFVILDGAVDVLLRTTTQRAAIYGLSVGDTFGHMSLMTGAARFATVRATGHLAVAEIGKAALAPILRAHPAAIDLVAEEILRIDASRRRGATPIRRPARGGRRPARIARPAGRPHPWLLPAGGGLSRPRAQPCRG